MNNNQQLTPPVVDFLATSDRFVSSSRLHGRLHRYQLLLRRWWWLVSLILLMVVAPVYLFTVQLPPAYQSKARMWLTGRLNLNEGRLYTEELVDYLSTQAELLRSSTIQQRALAKLRRDFTNDFTTAAAGGSRGNLSLVQRETERCSAIVRNLLDFARERPLELKEVDLVQVVEESLQLVAHQLAMQGHELDRRLSPVPLVRADFGQLRQALVNVILNGAEAMSRGGRLTITTGPSPDGRWAEVVVADTGPGISRENLSRIFDPFFTTKEMGTGLGLSVVYGIVQRHGGTVEVSSDIGQGTRFTFRLPAAPAAAA